ncbi:hypothetical protein [Streptomyces hirsutus]
MNHAGQADGTRALPAAVPTAGCGSSDDTGREPTTSASSLEGFPVTIDNCGARTTYAKPPSRVVTVHQHPAELLLALGLKDRMVGTALPGSAVLPEPAKDFEAIPELAQRETSFEEILDTEPDFVHGATARRSSCSPSPPSPMYPPSGTNGSPWSVPVAAATPACPGPSTACCAPMRVRLPRRPAPTGPPA